MAVPACDPGGYLTPVRTLTAMALLLLACGTGGGCADSSSRSAGAGVTPSIPGGPDPIILRVPQTGGQVVAYAYPALDSVVWRSSGRAPALRRAIAFGAEDGYFAAVDAAGAPVRIDLRLGTVAVTRDSSLAVVASADGADMYALTRAGQLTRYTPNGGDWTFRPPLPAQALYPQLDGSLIVAGVAGDRLIVWRVRPPAQTVSDSVSFSIGSAVGTALPISLPSPLGSAGDRVYVGVNESIVAVRSRDMGSALDVALGDPVSAIAATPSGDRLFVAVSNDETLQVVDRFEESVSAHIRMESPARGLRMDPLGRLLLARGNGDSVYVISVANDEVLGVVLSEWRDDLPLVLPDGALALARSGDVVITKPGTLADGRRIANGARDFWHVLRWNGFRPRAAGLDQPVEFRRSRPRPETSAGADSTQSDTLPSNGAAGTLPVRSDTLRPPSNGGGSTRRDSVFTVSFAAVLDERAARAVAGRIRVDGQRARITTSERAGRTLYRVIMGPYPSREQAERVGKASGQDYWIFEGAP